MQFELVFCYPHKELETKLCLLKEVVCAAPQQTHSVAKLPQPDRAAQCSTKLANCRITAAAAAIEQAHHARWGIQRKLLAAGLIPAFAARPPLLNVCIRGRDVSA